MPFLPVKPSWEVPDLGTPPLYSSAYRWWLWWLSLDWIFRIPRTSVRQHKRSGSSFPRNIVVLHCAHEVLLTVGELFFSALWETTRESVHCHSSPINGVPSPDERFDQNDVDVCSFQIFGWALYAFPICSLLWTGYLFHMGSYLALFFICYWTSLNPSSNPSRWRVPPASTTPHVHRPGHPWPSLILSLRQFGLPRKLLHRYRHPIKLFVVRIVQTTAAGRCRFPLIGVDAAVRLFIR